MAKVHPPENYWTACENSMQSKTDRDYLTLFLQSIQANEVSPGSVYFYRVKLSKLLDELNVDKANQRQIERLLLQFTNPGNRHAYYRAIKTFYR
jgi:hypothetical protein